MVLKKFIFSMFVCFLVSKVSAQVDTTKTYYPNGKIEAEVVYENNYRQGEAKFYWENGNLKETRIYLNDKVEGAVKTFYNNGQTKESYFIENSKRVGPYVAYDSLGSITDQAYFEDGMRDGQEYLLVGKFRKEDRDKLIAKWKEQQEQKKNSSKEDEFILPPVEQPVVTINTDSIYFTEAEVMPEPIGGMNTIYKKLVYPAEAKEKEIEGVVKVQVYIEKNGEISSAKVLEGIGYGCDENARLSVYYTRFKPGLQKGKSVKIQMIIPIEFKLDKSSN